MCKRFFFMLCCILPVSICLSANVSADDEVQRLEEIGSKARIIDAKRCREEKRLQDIDARIYSHHLVITDVKEDIGERSRQVRYYELQVDHYKSALKRSRGALKAKWVGLYKGTFLDIIDAFCGNGEYVGYLKPIIDQDRDMLDEYRSIQIEMKEAGKRLDMATESLRADLDRLEQKEQVFNEEREEKADLITSLHYESQAYQQEMKRLLKRIRKKEKKKAVSGPALKKGGLPWPVDGEIVRGFGTYMVGGTPQISHGIDIRAKQGSDVRSVSSGKVVYVNWMGKYGNTMILDHGGGYYSIYAHVGRSLKSTGDTVRKKDTIALVGQSGDVLNPTLHFEIRLHERPVDPAQWLMKQ